MARSLVRRRGDLGFCHYERSEVIQKQVLLVRRLLLSLRSIAGDKLLARRLLQLFKLSNDKNREQNSWASSFVMTRTVWQGNCHAVYSTRLAMTRFLGKNCEQEPFARSARQESFCNKKVCRRFLRSKNHLSLISIL